MSYSSDILADSPLAYWKLDESTGATTFADSSGNSRTATIGGTPTYNTTHNVDGNSVGFSGTQYGYTANSPAWLSSTSTYSVEAWFTTTATGSRALVMYDQSSHSPGATDRFFMFYLSNGAVIFNPFNSGGTYVTLTSPLATYNDGIWHHAVGTWDGTTVRLYIDGSQVNSTALSGTSPTGVGAPITIGAGCNNGLGNYLQYSGSLDEIALYGTTLNSTQVSTHYTSGIAALPSEARVESVYTEAMDTGIMNAQVESSYVESMDYGQVNTQVEASYLYTMDTGILAAQVEASFLEVMTPVEPVQVETVYSESLIYTTPPSQIEAVYAESMISSTPPIQADTTYIEVMLLPGPVTRFVGWGSRI